MEYTRVSSCGNMGIMVIYRG